ncbi:MAG: hypothetical protein WBC93_05735 [Sulfitobacter sp.]
MSADPKTEVLATVRASQGRRILGITSLGGLGLLLVWLALTTSPTFIWQLFLIILAAAVITLADRMRRATTRVIELTETELRDSTGVVLAQVADIQSMDRGTFAFKPSNGFLLKTKTPGARGWQPGMWWRLGRRIGIGGMTPGSQTKAMTEIIAALIARRPD